MFGTRIATAVLINLNVNGDFIMKHQKLLYEAIDLLKVVRSQLSETDSCVIKRLDQSIQELESLKAEDLTETELSCSIVNQLGMIFSEFPEVRKVVTELEETAFL